ncbi:hypothetical protein ACRRTK_012395 [Alexandromys fortis]
MESLRIHFPENSCLESPMLLVRSFSEPLLTEGLHIYTEIFGRQEGVKQVPG